MRKYWRQKLLSLKSQCHDITNKCPEAVSVVKQVYKLLIDIEILARYTPAKVGGSSECTTAMNRAVMTYACPAWELVAHTYLLKLQRLQNKVLRTNGNFPRCTPVRDLHKAFNCPNVYYYVTKLCRKQAEVTQNHENEYVRGIGQGGARHRKYKRLKLGGGQAYYRFSE
jgi:hypothetical protein